MGSRARVARGGRTAAVLGATGATGAKVVEELLARDEWVRVVAVGRRAAKGEDPKGKLVNVSSELPEAELAKALAGVEHLFNCVGTTRAAAGSAENFFAVEVTLSEKVALASKAAGCKSASVVSAGGASADRWLAPTWFHPLFYGKCMGLKEKTAIDNFPRATLFRPGMLHRGLTDRPMEKYLGFLPSLDVGLLAKAMVNDAESTPVAGKEEPHFVSGNGTITALAKV